MRKVKVAIIGAGTAGLSARREVSKVTDDYVVIDGGKLGTTCARVGCMPSKVLIQAANDYARRKVFVEEGIYGGDNLTVNYQDVMQFVRKLRDRFVRGVFSDMESWQEKLIQKYARFIDAHTLDLGDERIQAEKIIIASGSTPIVPKSWQKYQEHLIDTDQFFELDTLPEKVVVIGLGVIGIELGQALHNLGLDVTLVGLGKSIGGITDPKLQDYIAEKYASQMNVSFNGADVKGVDNNKLEVEIDGKIKTFDKAILALGRKPNYKQLNFDALDLNYNEKSVPSYSETTYQIDGYPHVYLVGDNNVQRPLLHEAADQGRIAGFNAVRQEQHCFQKRTFLAITFSDPNIAVIGQSYEKLTQGKIDFAIGEVSFEGQGRSIVKSHEQGMLRIYACKKSGKILGVELQAPDGEHLAHLLSWAISNQMTVDEVLAMPFYHPTVEEGVRTALRNVSRQLNIESTGMELFRCGDTPIR
jgi:dihydrolipoamide dehydrogenase